LTAAELGAVVAVAEALGTAIRHSIEPITRDSHLSTHRDLQEIADKGWNVPTHVLARVLGQSTSSLQGWGQVTHRYGFCIERTGRQGMFCVSPITRSGIGL